MVSSIKTEGIAELDHIIVGRKFVEHFWISKFRVRNLKSHTKTKCQAIPLLGQHHLSFDRFHGSGNRN